MKEIKTYLPEELVDRLSIEAKEKGVHRSRMIRERLSQPLNHLGLTTSDFHKAVTKVRRRSAMVWIGNRLKALSLYSTNSSAHEMATRSVNLQYCQISDEHCHWRNSLHLVRPRQQTFER